jgi:hypothetical protein
MKTKATDSILRPAALGFGFVLVINPYGCHSLYRADSVDEAQAIVAELEARSGENNRVTLATYCPIDGVAARLR